ncbi:hypothetical protein JW835_10000 [bacterium]|nr:hypothetical protein [bacterium]
MADRPKGNLWLELGIVVLTIALLFTILYPKKIWNEQEQFQNVCRSRMEALQQMEYQYLNVVNTYEDTLKHLLSVIKQDTSLLMALDTLVQWDGIVTKPVLKQMVMETSLPQDLRHLIRSRIDKGLPLGNLTKWDSLSYRMIADLKKDLVKTDISELLDNSVDWRVLMGESGFWTLFENTTIPRSSKISARKALRRGTPIQETEAWQYLRDTLFVELENVIEVAEKKDVWRPEEKDAWEERAKEAWEKEMDAMSDAEKDSMWIDFQEEFWDKESKLIWKEDKKKIWKREGERWKEENRDVWMRTIENEWKMETKKEWIAEHREGKPDSVIKAFEAVKDSLWRTQVDSLKDAKFSDWQKRNKKFVNNKIDEIWELERKGEWELDAKQNWLDGKRRDFDKFWSELKEGVWNDLRYEFWTEEERKLKQKISAMNKLDKAVLWKNVIDCDIQTLVQSLDLPDNHALWEKIDQYDPKKGSALIALGVTPLFRSTLLDSVSKCPEVHLNYIIDIDTTERIQRFSISCPIKDKEYEKHIFGIRAPIALLYKGEKLERIVLRFPLVKMVSAKKAYIKQVNPETGEIEEIFLKPGFFERVFGAKKIESHGLINKDAKRSWAKPGT